MSAQRHVLLTPEELEDIVRRAIRAELDVDPETDTSRPKAISEHDIERARKRLRRMGRAGA